MPPYLTFSILSLCLFSISSIVFKLTAKHSMPNPSSWYFWYFFIYFLLGILLPFFVPVKIIPLSISQLKFNFAYAAFIYTGIFFFAQALYHLDVTTMGPLSNLSNVFVPILAFLFLGEKIASNSIVWLILIVVCGFLAAYDEKLKLKSFSNKYIYSFLLFVLFLSVTRIFVNKGINSLGYWNFTFYQFFYGSFLLLLITPFIYKKISVGLKPILFMIPGVILEFFALLSLLKALSYQIIVPSIIVSIPLSSLIVFAISRFDKNILEDHPLKTYVIRFSSILVMTLALIKIIKK